MTREHLARHRLSTIAVVVAFLISPLHAAVLTPWPRLHVPVLTPWPPLASLPAGPLSAIRSSPPVPLSVPERGDVVSSPSPEGRGGQGVRTIGEGRWGQGVRTLERRAGQEVTIPLAEHPRPDFQREQWQKLHGPW